jgi:hypothetical protein
LKTSNYHAKHIVSAFSVLQRTESQVDGMMRRLETVGLIWALKTEGNIESQGGERENISGEQMP